MVEIGRGVQMSCQEVDDDHAVIRFVCPCADRRRGAAQAPNGARGARNLTFFFAGRAGGS